MKPSSAKRCEGPILPIRIRSVRADAVRRSRHHDRVAPARIAGRIHYGEEVGAVTHGYAELGLRVPSLDLRLTAGSSRDREKRQQSDRANGSHNNPPGELGV